MVAVTYLEGINQGLRECLSEDADVVLLGEDIGHFGGAFKVTAGLLDQFGPRRVMDTPIAESAIVGWAVGAAMRGLRPVAEIQFADFLACGHHQVVNNAAMTYYRTGTPVPLTLRLPCGSGPGGGPFHCQNPEATYCHVPGLKVVAPATAADAKGLLKASVYDDNPVLFFENKYLYRRIKDNGPLPAHSARLGEAAVRRTGDDLTFIAYGASLHDALEAAEKLAEEDGATVEVLDLRTLKPLDTDAILEAVAKTGRVLVAHEAWPTCSVGAEVAALIADQGFELLDAPIRRVAALDVPAPFAPGLFEAYYPGVPRLLQAARELLEY
jgi:2-oxoisovalerate dehydrogenase E1 component beta subunit